MQRKRFAWISVAVAAFATTVAGAAMAASTSSKDVTLNLVAYSTPRPVLTKLIDEFRKTPQGSGVTIRASYGPSSAQGQAVANGLPADGVILNTGNDINNLVDKGLINRNWDKQSYNGVVWNSVVVFGLRDGNPKKIKGWNDLLKPGVQVVTVNPFTGGIAKWNILSAYVAQRRLGKTDKQAIAYLKKFFQHVPVQPDSARAALQVFAQGKGDVLITYENEAIYAEKKGVHTEYKTPKSTLLIETPVALTKTGLQKPAAKAFYKYLWSATAQKAFAAQGFRPVLPSVAKHYKFYKPAGLFTITSTKLGLNGWTKVQTRFFHPQNGIVAKIEKSLGH